MVACSVANGPSTTVTESPTSKSRTVTSARRGFSFARLSGRGSHDLVDGQRRRLVGVADEAGDAGGVA